VMPLGWGLGSLLTLALALAAGNVLAGVALVVLAGAVQAPARSAAMAVVADLVPPARHEIAYSTVRVANNLGTVLGPPIAGLLLLGETGGVDYR
jgi:MFS family permease